MFVSVAVTEPAVVALNGWVTPPLTLTLPVNVSVTGFGVGVVMVGVSSPQLVHASVATATSATRRNEGMKIV
jgi:hypothetical protein